jgi:hypothetical protein
MPARCRPFSTLLTVGRLRRVRVGQFRRRAMPLGILR